MLDRYMPFRTSKALGKDFDKLLKKYGVSQSWMLRYLFAQALSNLDPKILKQAIKLDPMALVKPKKGLPDKKPSEETEETED